MANVIFKQGTRAQYDAIAAKDVNTLYWLTDTQELFKGEVLYGKGAEATALASGLMSAADKAKLDSLASGGAIGLTAVDASVILGSDDNGTTIGVQVSKSEGNALELKEDGLFVSPAAASGTVEFAIEKQRRLRHLQAEADCRGHWHLRRRCYQHPQGRRAERRHL